MLNNKWILIRGGGDLASGVALRLHHARFQVAIAELPQPLAVRRAVSFADAVYQGVHTVEDVTARLVKREQVEATLEADEIPVLIDPQADILHHLGFFAVVDGRLLKKNLTPLPVNVPLHIGLGPGFRAGENCHAVVETRRSHTLGRVYWNGESQADTRQPEGDPRRVLRATTEGILSAHAKIGDHLEEGDVICAIQDEAAYGSPIRSEADGAIVTSPFKGVLRGLIHDNLKVTRGLKIGDVDPRDDASACFLVSDKALAIGGGVLEALMAKLE